MISGKMSGQRGGTRPGEVRNEQCPVIYPEKDQNVRSFPERYGPAYGSLSLKGVRPISIGIDPAGIFQNCN